MRRLQRTLARAQRGSNRRGRVRRAIARLKARETDRRKDWAEKISTDIARRFDVIRVEDLHIINTTLFRRKAPGRNPGRSVRQKAGLNRGILRVGVGAAGAAAAGQGPRPGGEDQTRVHEPAVLGVRASGPGLA